MYDVQISNNPTHNTLLSEPLQLSFKRSQF